MSDFAIRVETEHSPAVAWERLWDLERHTATIPLTRVTLDEATDRLGEGAGFTGRTALGPLGFDDTMTVVAWLPPVDGGAGRAVVEKTGRALGGRIEVTVSPLRSGSEVVWRQTVVLPWLPGPLRRLEALAARAVAPGYRHVIRRLLG